MRAVAEQGVLALAVALREVFLVSVAAQEMVTRAEAVREVPARVVLLQEVAGLVVAVREVLARSVAGLRVGGAPGGRGDAGGVRAPTKEHEYTPRRQGPCASLLPRFRRTVTRVVCTAR